MPVYEVLLLEITKILGKLGSCKRAVAFWKIKHEQFVDTIHANLLLKNNG